MVLPTGYREVQNDSVSPGLMCIGVTMAKYQFNLAKMLQLCINVYFGQQCTSDITGWGLFLATRSIPASTARCQVTQCAQ